MGRNRSLIIGLICAGISASCVGLYVMDVDRTAEQERIQALERYGGEQIEVCVARRDIMAGETLSDNIIETRLWVTDLLPDNAVVSKGELIGKQVRSSILKGEVIAKARLGSGDSILEVPEGLVAVSVPAKDVQAVGGAIKTGMKVDVYATGPTTTSLLLPRVLVMATSVDDVDSLAAETITWITLAVLPESVSTLIEAAQNLNLYFSLPNDEGESAV